MKLQVRALRKWSAITVVCGATSFFWGFMAKASPIAMLLGLLSLILLFSLIESHPAYQARRAARPRMARALDWGVKFRVFLALYIIAIVALGAGFSAPRSLQILGYPYMGELLIGVYSMMLCQKLTGIDLNAMGRVPAVAGDGVDHFIATYLTTIITGVAHTTILALICGMVYGAMCIVTRLRKTTT